MRLLLSLVLFVLIAGFACEGDGFECYQNCAKAQWSKPNRQWDSAFLSICKRVLPNDDIQSPCNVTTASPLLGCFQKCDKCNLTNVRDESTGILNEYCAKGGRSSDALRVNVKEFCANWDTHVDSQNCTQLKGCDMTACTLDKTVKDIAYAYSEDSVKYATSFVKLLLGALPEQDDVPIDKGCDIIYRRSNAANGLHATGVILTFASITSLIHAL